MIKGMSYTWSMETIADSFIGKLIEVIDYEPETVRLAPVIQTDAEMVASQSQNFGFWNPKLRGFHNAWRFDYQFNKTPALEGKKAMEHNPMLVVDVVRSETKNDGKRGWKWELVVIIGEKYYSVNMMNALVVKTQND